MSYQKLELKLASNTHQSEHMEQNNLPQNIERFEKIVTTQHKIQNIKTDLTKLIQSIDLFRNYQFIQFFVKKAPFLRRL